MTEQQVKEWMGLGHATRRLLPAIVEGMADYQVPSTGHEHLIVFTAFLRCAGPAGTPIFQPAEGAGS